MNGGSSSSRAVAAATRFTILICTHNRAGVLADTLESVAALEFDGEWEILVVDNASADDTVGVVRAAAAAHPVPIRYERENNPGKSAALNTGIRAWTSRPQYFTFMSREPGVTARVLGVPRIRVRARSRRWLPVREDPSEAAKRRRVLLRDPIAQICGVAPRGPQASPRLVTDAR